jgi:hypothetical protein
LYYERCNDAESIPSTLGKFKIRISHKAKPSVWEWRKRKAGNPVTHRLSLDDMNPVCCEAYPRAVGRWNPTEIGPL